MGKAIAMIMYAEIVKNALLLVRVEINFIDFPNLDKKNLDNYNFTQPIKMNNDNITTHSNDNPHIDPVSLLEAIKILEQSKISDGEIHKMIATLAKMMGAETFVTKLVPKGRVIIGTGEMDFPPYTTPELLSSNKDQNEKLKEQLKAKQKILNPND